MKTQFATSLLIPVLLMSVTAVALPKVQSSTQVEIWSRGLSARLEMAARGQHFEMTVRTNGGQSTWKQVHRRDVAKLMEKLSTFDALVAADQNPRVIKSAGCRSGWVRLHPYRPTERKACLDLPASASPQALKAMNLAREIAADFENLVKAPEAPIVLRQNGGAGDEPVPVIDAAANQDPFAPSEEDRLARIEAEVEAAESFETSEAVLPVAANPSARDPFQRPGRASLQKPPAPAKRAPASARSPVLAQKPKTEQGRRQLKKLESMVRKIEKYIATTPSLSAPQRLQKLAPKKEDLLGPAGGSPDANARTSP